MTDIRKAYHTILRDHFPDELTLTLGDQKLVYRKRVWTITDADTGQVEVRGLRYGENPGQEAALYELVSGAITLADCQYIRPGRGLVSALSEADLLQFGKHPSKTNLTDVDAAFWILKYLMDTPFCCIIKHNNPCGVAVGESPAEA